ncbi:MAG: outer membrane beta-barrel domain-containing protein [Clostridia bacterium]|nr:outer membrane beta-barrel domain-containing protein [Deltaproteobacteria bacterium]
MPIVRLILAASLVLTVGTSALAQSGVAQASRTNTRERQGEAPAPLAEPVYNFDAFHDGDFDDETPLVLEVKHPTKHRVDIALMYTSSLVDKYVGQNGAALDVRYHLSRHWGIGAQFGYFDGDLTEIVRDSAGVFGNRVAACRAASATTCDLNLRLPDTRQMTGNLDLTLVWLPFYGKLNIVSELDSDIQLYLAGGGGVNGTRTTIASFDNSIGSGYVLSGNGFGDGGLFGNAVAHGTIVAGATLFLTNWLAVRAELRVHIFHTNDDFNGDGVTNGYTSWREVGQIGLVVSP